VTMGSLVPLCSSFLWTPQPWHPYTTTASSSSSRSSSGATELYMGKGLNKQKNKQMDLKRKMELAKLQKQGIDTDADTDAAASAENDSKLGLTQEEIKERNDRRRFEQLLQREGTKMFSDYESDGYLNTKQVEEEISAQRKFIFKSSQVFSLARDKRACFFSIYLIFPGHSSVLLKTKNNYYRILGRSNFRGRSGPDGLL